MPLHGKIVVIKRSGGDGTEFPLTASCLFGRKADCDIRIQLPQVSKEHCRIDLNENKELILTNLSSVNPTRVNGEVLQQSERLKHGDVITVIDRSFRFEYPPAPTPKKRRSSTASKTETLQVLQDQQVRDAAAGDAGDKRISEVSTDLYLKDGANSDNIQRPLEKTVEVETKEDGSVPQSQTSSPFGELYQMIKQTLDVKTPRKSSFSQPQTPASRFYTPKPQSAMKVGGKPAVSTEVKDTPMKVEAEISSATIAAQGSAGVENKSVETPKSGKKQRRSSQVLSSETTGLVAEKNKPTEQAAKSAATPSPRQRLPATPQRFTASEVVDQVSAGKPKTPTRRRSKETTPVKPSVSKGEEEQPKMTEVQQNTPKRDVSLRTSPRSSQKKLKAQDVATAGNEKQERVKKRKSGELGADLPAPQVKKKRVSFGGHLSPELFDKRLPPDSPLCKGATPRRSLSLSKPKQSLLRRASVIGLIEEFEHEHASPAKTKTQSPKKSPKARSPSPKTPSPGKKSPKAKTPSPKTPSPGKKSPKAKTPSPKTPSSEKKSPKARTPSPKSGEVKSSPGRQSSASAKTPSPARGRSPSSGKFNTPKAEKSVTPVRSRTPTAVCVTPAKSPLSLEKETPTMQGRFSVSRISTPSPITEQEAVADPAPSVHVTPKLPLRRKSMKSSSKKSAAEVMRRRSGISRASLKAKNSWVDVVKFGQKKTQVAAPPKKTLTTKTRKVAVPKPQTPARRLIDHVSTGHADSPVTIVVGKAHQRNVVQPTGAAPRLVHNTALLKKEMKMDEDLTGIAEIFKTPANARLRKSVINEQTVTKTPQGALSTTVIEASVLNTPEETGEMMVSPLSVAPAVNCRTYNSEAVHRLLQGEDESSFVSEIPALEISSDGSAEQQCTDLKTSVTTPKQKPVQPECLTGVKRIMKTPRQKPEPVEDLRGKLLKTPKQKPEQPECLTGVKRIMKTPRLKAEPVEDLRGKLLKTPKAPKVADVAYDGIQELLETPKQKEEPVEDLAEVMALKTPNVKSSPLVCATGIKRLMRTPKEKTAPVEDMDGVKRLMKTPKTKGEPVEANFGIKRLMRSPKQEKNAPVEDFEGLQELMEEPCSAQAETTEEMETLNQDQTPLDCAVATEEAEVPCEEQQEDVPCAQSDNGPSEDVEDVPQADMVKEAEMNEVVQLEEVPCGLHDEPSDTMETVPEAAVDQSLPEEQPEVQTATCEVTEMDTASIAPDTQKKSTRGRRAKVVEATEHLEETTVPAPVRGRRAKKTESAPSPAVRQTARSRKAQSNEDKDAELTVEASDSVKKVAPKPKRGRNTKKVSADQAEVMSEVAVEAEVATEVAVEAEMVSEVAVEAEVVSEVAVEVVSDQIPPTNAVPEVHDSVTPVEEADLKPKRGRGAKPASVKRAQKVSEITEVVSDQPQLEETSPIEAQSEEPSPAEAPPVPTISVEKPRRGRKTKQDSAEQNEMVEAPVRAKRGRNVKHEEEEEKVEVPVVETTESQEPIEKSKRTRKAKQNPVEPKEVDMVEDPVKEKVEAPPVASKARRTRMTKQDSAESVEMPVESASSATLAQSVEPAEKPRRGRKAKQDPEHVESTEVQDKPSANPTEKPKRGRRTKQETVIEEAEIITEVSEEKAEPSQEVEENRDDADSSSALADQQPDAPVVKPTRGRGAKSSVKNEISQTTPAKRARRGAAASLQEAAVTEATVVSKSGTRGRAGRLSKADTADEPAEVSVAPVRKGRKAAAKPTTDATVVESTEAIVEEKENAEPVVVEVNKGKVSRRGKAASAARSDKANATEDVDNAVVENMTMSKKSVNWKDDLAVTYEITSPAVVAKAPRGRKTKLVDPDEASQGTATKRSRRNPEPTVPCTSETATKPENKRKASRNANKAEEEDLSGKAVPSEPVKKARRGGKAADTASVEAPTPVVEEVESTPKVPAKRRVNASKKAVAVDGVQAVEPETQPKPRRGRQAKK